MSSVIVYNNGMSIGRFEKISKTQFQNDLKNIFNIEDDLYENVLIPKRATKGSAGYDFYSPIDLTIKPGQLVKIPTGIRCFMEEGYVLTIHPRSSLGLKYQMCLANTTGIIDADYYNAANEGHILVPIVNRGDKDLVINKGDRFVQGIFLKFYTVDEEEISTERTGGFGSSN